MSDSVTDEMLALRRYCICIIEYLSNQAIDPHLYFRQKMIGEVTQMNSVEALIELMRRLIGWVETVSSSPAQSGRLDSTLAEHGFPPLSEIRTSDDESIVKMLAEC
jgi:hypothetical protein